MSHQITKVDLIPSGELSVCNVSQFDNGRVLPFEILENKEAYNIPNDIRVELHCRKADGNIVTLPSENITDNIVTFLSTTQLTACYGRNVCEIALYGPDDYLIGSGNFVLEVERDPLLGGINSTSAIHNLEEQIEEITSEIIGEDYYNKSEVDGLLSDKANAADVYTKSQVDSALANKANAADVYTKSQVDNALAVKANAADVYTKSQVDNALAFKANAADVYTKSQVDNALALKANAADVYTKQEVDNKILDIMPVDTASGAIATFDTEIAAPLVNVSCNIVATGGNGTPYPAGGGVNLCEEVWESGFIASSGVETPSVNSIRSKNYNPVGEGVSLYLYAPNVTTSSLIAFYDANKSFLDYYSLQAGGRTITTPAGATYFRISLYNYNSGIYDNAVSVNYPSTDHDYHPYANISPINGYSSANITRCGVNLFDKDSGNVINAYLSTKIEALSVARTVFAKCKQSTQYTISKTAGQRFTVAYTKELPEINVNIYGAVQDSTASHISITTGADAKYIVAMVYNSNVDSGTAEEMLASVQIAEGTDTTYHPYNGQTYTIAFGQTVYGGVLDVTRGKLTVTCTINEDMSALSWVETSSPHIFFAGIQGKKAGYTSYLLCEQYAKYEGYFSGLGNNQISSNNSLNYIYVRNDNCTTVSDITTALSNCKLVYELATPFDIDLTPEVISAIVGVNNVYSDTNGDTTVQYKDSIQHYIDKHIGG